MAQFIQKSKESVLATGDFVGLHGDEEIFGNKDFINDVIIRGDLNVSGSTRVTEIIDFTSQSGDISGHVFRGQVGYFDQIVVGDIIGSDAGGSSGESSGGIDTGPIFVTNVTAVGGVREILESEFSGAVIRKARTASDQVDVQLLVERGDAQTFKPSISYAASGASPQYQDVAFSELSTNGNGYSFNATLRLDCIQPVTYLFKNGGRQTYLSLEKDTPPEVLEAKFVNRTDTGTFYGESSFNAHDGNQTHPQTEAKNGDAARVYVKSSKEIGKIVVSGGALQSKTVNNPNFNDNGDGTYDFEFNVNIGGASNGVQVKGFSVTVQDITGNQSQSYASDNDIITNNTSPSVSLSFAYPNANNVINNTGETVDVNVTAINFDNYNYSKSAVLMWKAIPGYVYSNTMSQWNGSGVLPDINSEPFVVSGENASNYTSGTVSISVFKQSNGKTSSSSTSAIQIQSAGTVPSVNFSPNVFKSSSAGAQYSNVTVSVGEPLNSLSILSVSDANINVGAISKNNNTSFSFQILVSDSTPRGPFTINFEGEKLIGETFQRSDDGTVRGFNQRSVTILAPDYLAVGLGVDVYNTSKLTATATPDGGNTFSVPYDAGITAPKQDGTSNLEAGFGIINGSELIIDNQVITNAGNILDVTVTIEEAL
jgi:hypothetical protein